MFGTVPGALSVGPHMVYNPRAHTSELYLQTDTGTTVRDHVPTPRTKICFVHRCTDMGILRKQGYLFGVLLIIGNANELLAPPQLASMRDSSQV